MIKKYLSLIFLFLLIPSLGWGACTSTGTKDWTTDGNEYADFKECLDEVTGAADKDGHTINVIAGDGAATWGTKISITHATPNLHIKGPGKDNLTINLDAAISLFDISDDGVTPCRTKVSGFTFNKVSTSASSFFFELLGREWRVTNNKFTADSGAAYIMTIAADGSANESTSTFLAGGLIDNNYFYNTTIHFGTPLTASVQNGSYYDSTIGKTGAANSIYVENNVFEYVGNGVKIANIMDSNQASRLVTRFNNIKNYFYETHPANGDLRRSGRLFEVYNNYFEKTNSGFAWAFSIRGGSGVIFNNKAKDTSNSATVLGTIFSYRATQCVCGGTNSTNGTCVGLTCADYSMRMCNGSSPWDGNEAIGAAVASVYGTSGAGTAHTGDGGACTDNCAKLVDTGAAWIPDSLIGITVYNTTSGKESSCIITDNDATSVTCTLSGSKDWDIGDTYKITNGYPCHDQVGRGNDATLVTGHIYDNMPTPPPAQDIEPIYMWGNINNSGTRIGVYAQTPGWVVSDRDYCASTEGTGTPDSWNTNMPASCGSHTNTYEPYDCPHPLATEYAGYTCNWGTYGAYDSNGSKEGLLGGNGNISIGSGASMSVGSGAVMTLQ